MTRRATWFRSLLALSLAALSTPARADASAPCMLSDTTSPSRDAPLHEAASDGKAIALFTGAPITVRLTQPPKAFAGARIRVETGDGRTPGLRLKGWVDTGAFRYFAKRKVPIVPDHVWLTKGVELRPVGAGGDGLEVEHAMLGVRNTSGGPRNIRVLLPCESVALAPPGIELVEAPSGVRWYHMRERVMTLHDRPRGDVVFELRMHEDAQRVFWAVEAKPGWLHIVAPGDVSLDGWVKLSQVELLPAGERIDLSALEPAPLATARVGLENRLPAVTTTADLSVHSRPEPGAPLLGVMEAGAAFHVASVSTSWTGILPASLALAPPEGGSFWVKTEALPKP